MDLLLSSSPLPCAKKQQYMYAKQQGSLSFKLHKTKNRANQNKTKQTKNNPKIRIM
jgi:hypothetical protein